MVATTVIAAFASSRLAKAEVLRQAELKFSNCFMADLLTLKARCSISVWAVATVRQWEIQFARLVGGPPMRNGCPNFRAEPLYTTEEARLEVRVRVHIETSALKIV